MPFVASVRVPLAPLGARGARGSRPPRRTTYACGDCCRCLLALGDSRRRLVLVGPWKPGSLWRSRYPSLPRYHVPSAKYEVRGTRYDARGTRYEVKHDTKVISDAGSGVQRCHLLAAWLRAGMAQESRVVLHVYDLSKDPSIRTANDFLRVFGTGIFHTAVEVYGQEWSYGGSDDPGTGLFSVDPSQCMGHRHREVIEMGSTTMDKKEVQQLLEQLKGEWKALDYDTLGHNCTHFTDTFCSALGVGAVPARFSNLAETGKRLDSISVALINSYKQLLRPWSEFAAVRGRGAAAAGDWVERLPWNLMHFQANYLVFTVAFLTLMVMDISHPLRLGAVIVSVCVWAAFLWSGCRNSARILKIGGFDVNASHCEALTIAASALLGLAVLGHGLVLCTVLSLVHASLHPGLCDNASSKDGCGD